MKAQQWWALFQLTGAPEAYLAYRAQKHPMEERNVSENRSAGAAGDGVSGRG